MNPKIDAFLEDGCGRCSLYKTPECKALKWSEEIRCLRAIALECNLEETYKWSQPCYTVNDKNIILISAFKDYAFVAFFKGVLLADNEKLLVAPGKHSQASRQLRFTKLSNIKALESTIKSYILEAIEIEGKGLKVKYNNTSEPIPVELNEVFELDHEYKNAFFSLTLGRQRGYLIHFSQAKRPTTRLNRINKQREKIIKGLGMHDYPKNK